MSTLKVNTIDSHSGSLLTIDSTADVLVASSTTATSSTTGALKVTGGISTQENLYVGGNAVITGTMTANGGTITLGDAGTDNVTIGGEINSDVIPDATNTYDLGSSAKKWAEIHATTFTGALTGNVTGNTSGSAGSCTGNSATATILATGRTVAMTGDGTWNSGSFNGSANVTAAMTLANSGVSAASYGSATAIPVITVDAKGRLTSATTVAVSSDMAMSSDSGTGTITVGTDTLTITGGTNVNTSMTGDTVTVNLDASPALSGTPTAPTASANTNTTQVATTAYVQTELTDLIDGAPGTLDTLNELAAAINDDASYSSTLTTALATKTAKTSNQSLGSAANAMTISGNTITLARGDSTTDTVTVPDTNTTYSVGDGGLTQINFTSADNTKLDAIEASADVTDVTNVTAAGALMDSEVTNLASVKAFATTDYATAAQGTTADNALPKAGGAMTGAITTNSTFDGVDIATRDGVLTSTTTTANAALPKAGGAMTGAITTNSTFDGRDVATDGTKLDGIASSATNVTNNNQITNGAGYITSYTNTTYSAGSGLDISGTTFSVEPDLRDGITHVGLDAGDYIGWTNNTHTSFFVNAGEELRLEADGDLHADGDVIAYSTTISDERLKTGIMPITNALAKVNKLNGCTFTYLSDGKKSAGLIAQDVEKVLPTAVSEKELPLKMDDGEKYKVLQYDQTIGLLVEAIKELSAKVEELGGK